jgi:hypothetical protein
MFVKLYFENPLRDDYRSAIFVRNKDDATSPDSNYLVIPPRGNSYVILNKYKTVNRYGSKKLPFTQETTQLIRNYCKNKQMGTNLLGTINMAAAANAVNFPTMRLVNECRKSVASTRFYVNKEKSAEEIGDLCYVMGHTQAVHLESYIRPIEGIKASKK